MLRPQFGSNPAIIGLDSDGATFENFTTTSFDYQRQLAPRVWIEALQCNQLGIRAVYWQFDHAAGALSVSPPANGFGRVSTPSFGNVILSTTVPDSSLNTVADLNAYSIDLKPPSPLTAVRGAGWLRRACGTPKSISITMRRCRMPPGIPRGRSISHIVSKGLGPRSPCGRSGPLHRSSPCSEWRGEPF